MRVALLSDVHANLTALDAVLAAASASPLDAIWHMGDIVGYGPQPLEVIQRLAEVGAAGVLGNHDAAAIGAIGVDEFNALAAEAARWTAKQLDESARRQLAALPEVRTSDDVVRVHGTLRQPLWEYLVSAADARAHFALQGVPISIVGHTHTPVAIQSLSPDQVDARYPEDGACIELGDGTWCLNPGSVGQPRDSDPRASFAILDTSARAVTFHRVEYDIATTQRLILEAGLPEPLGARLAFGR